MLRTVFASSLVLIGLALSAINVYGLFQNIRMDGLMEDTSLRFEQDIIIDYPEAMQQVQRLEGESERDYAERMTYVISKSLAHIPWNEQDNLQYNVLIPIWENYFLYFMGKFSGIPEFEKYHYIDYRRSIERGVGICGDASMILSQLLDKQGIENKIMVFPGHVISQAWFSDGSKQLFDADFGVTLPSEADTLPQNLGKVRKAYHAEGYTDYDTVLLTRSYSQAYTVFDGVQHFLTKKYYFEYLTYALKWPLPIAMALFGWWLLRRRKTQPQLSPASRAA